MDLYVIGVDGGGSTTEAVVLDQDRRVLGRGAAGSSNYHNVGIEQAALALSEAMRTAVAAAGVTLDRISGAAWALAGVDRPEERPVFDRLGQELIPGVPLRVENDAMAALVGGTGGHHGIVLIAGTGMVAYGERGVGQRARAGGWGYLMDHGSAYDLVQEALRAVGRAHDGATVSTRLTDRLLEEIALQEPMDIIRWLYAPERQVSEIAALAPIVLEEAAKGDLVAMDVAVGAADALAEAVHAVARRLGFWGQSFPLLLGGTLLTTSDFYRALVVQAVRTRIPYVEVMMPLHDPAVGAGFLALENLGHLPDIVEEVEPVSAVDRNAAWLSEEPNVLSQDVDLRSSLELSGLMQLEARQAVQAVQAILPEIAVVTDEIAARMRRGGRLVYIGAGTSGRLGALDAAECPPTFNTAPGQVVSLIAGGPKALTRSIEGAEDDPESGVRALREIDLHPDDSVVGIAASGRTPYVLGALQEARRRGALAVTLICNLPSPLAENADHVLAPVVGPELVTGSTRLKAGTAQKIVLNVISTGVMVRLGKTYGNLMVDLRQANQKLRDRSRRIVSQACHIDEVEAAAVLDRCGGDVKVAIVSYLAGCTPEEAKARLARGNGVVRSALQEKGEPHK